MVGRRSTCMTARVRASLRGTLLVGVLALTSLVAVATEDPFDISALPTVELRFESPHWWAELLANRPSGALLHAHLRVAGQTFEAAGVRFHGRSSFSVHKVSRKVPFWIEVDTSGGGKTFAGRRTLILKNNFADPSLLREVLALKILGDYLPAPRASFVTLVINGERWGPYTSVELPDREFFARWFEDSSGAIMIGERAFDLATLRGRSCADRFPQVGPERPQACAALRHLLAVKDEADPPLRRRLLPHLLDVDEALRHLAAETAIGNTDGFPANNYTLYQDPSNGRFETIPWDYNLSFEFPELGLLPPRRGLLAEPSWYRRYRAYVRTIIEDSLDWERLGPWLARVRRLIDDAVRSDDKRLYPYELFARNLTEAVTLPGSSYSRPGIEEFVTRRRRWLERSGLGARPRPILRYSGPAPGPGPDLACLRVRVSGAAAAQVIVHVESAHLYRDVALRDDGETCDQNRGDGVFSLALHVPRPPMESRYYFSAETRDGDISFLPHSGGFRPFRLSASHLPPR